MILLLLIISKSNNYKWTFTTIYDRKYGSHPVSGNRDFGNITNPDGSYTFYTRGVDRLTSWDGDFMQQATGIPFDAADGLWKSFQNHINAFVRQNGGTSVKLSPQIERPDWLEVKDVVDGKKPLSSLNKDC